MRIPNNLITIIFAFTRYCWPWTSKSVIFYIFTFWTDWKVKFARIMWSQLNSRDWSCSTMVEVISFLCRPFNNFGHFIRIFCNYTSLWCGLRICIYPFPCLAKRFHTETLFPIVADSCGLSFHTSIVKHHHFPLAFGRGPKSHKVIVFTAVAIIVTIVVPSN